MSSSLPSPAAPYRLCPKCRTIYPATARFCGRDRSELLDDERIIAGKFILVRKIGEGAMGEVYEAEQPKMGRTVAVKLLRPDPVVMQRFDREVEAAGSIIHPNVITIYDSGRLEDGRGFIAMEYLEGEGLSKLLERQGPLPLARALAIWLQAVRAIAAAHGKGVVHRDLKPDNLFIARRVTEDGTEELVKVLDFGIAKLGGAAVPTRGTVPGSILGTMQYMAPEQLDRGQADARSDVFALGLILVEMLSGRLPWGEDKEQSYNLFALRLVRPPLQIGELCPGSDFSPALQRLLDDVLARAPEQRPAHAGELLQRVKTLPELGTGNLRDLNTSGPQPALPTVPVPLARLASMQSPAAPEPSREVPRPAAPPRRLLFIGVGLGLGAVALALIIARGRPRAPARARTAPTSAPQAPVRVPAVPAAQRPELPGAQELRPEEVKSGHRASHHAAAAPALQVQFAFIDAKGVRLTCGGRPLAAPDCSGSMCKSVVSVPAKQKCTVEKEGSRVTFSYADLKKIEPDLNGVIHKLVHFP